MERIHKEEIIKKIGQGKTIEAIEDILLILSKDDIRYSAFILLQGQWIMAQTHFQLGIEDRSPIIKELNRISASTLNLIQGIPNNIFEDKNPLITENQYSIDKALEYAFESAEKPVEKILHEEVYSTIKIIKEKSEWSGESDWFSVSCNGKHIGTVTNENPLIFKVKPGTCKLNVHYSYEGEYDYETLAVSEGGSGNSPEMDFLITEEEHIFYCGYSSFRTHFLGLLKRGRGHTLYIK